MQSIFPPHNKTVMVGRISSNADEALQISPFFIFYSVNTMILLEYSRREVYFASPNFDSPVKAKDKAVGRKDMNKRCNQI